MLMNDMIDNDGISNEMRSIYKFIEKHKRQIDETLNAIYNDLKGIFQNITIDKDMIIIELTEDICDKTKTIIDNSVHQHTQDILGTNYGDLSSYVFRVYYNDKSIQIIEKY